jgi:hypothetical protein
MVYLEELKEKRKSSLIVVCTLGLAALFLDSVRPIWMTNLFEGTSFGSGEMKWFFKMVSFVCIGLLTAAVLFVVHFIKVIYYSIEISKRS